MWRFVAGLTDRLMNRHKAIRRVALTWVMSVNSYVLYKFADTMALQPGKIGAAEATVITAAIGLVGTVCTFYIQSRAREDKLER